MVGWGVEVPATEIEGDVIICHAGQGCIIIFGMVQGESRPVAPIVVISRDVSTISVEVWLMGLGETLVCTQGDWGLLSATLTGSITCPSAQSAC